MDQPAEDVLCGTSPIRPLGVIEKRMNDVDHPEPGVDGVVHVAPDGLGSGWRLGQRRLTLLDGPIEGVEHHSTKQVLAIREVSVQGADTDTSSLSHSVAGRLATDLEDELSGGIEQPSPTAASVSAHQAQAAAVG